MAPTSTRCWCNQCLKPTDHDVLHVASYDEADEENFDWKTMSYTLRCRGCGDTCLREEITGDVIDADNPQVRYKPRRLWARPPSWVGKLWQVNPGLSDLLDEVYSATNEHQTRLLAMAIRTALDYAMNNIVGDMGGFEEKLQEMVAQGHLSANDQKNLAIVVDAGSATSHRGYKTSDRAHLQEMLTVMENVIRNHYITGPALLAMRKTIPPRPPRQSKKEPKPSLAVVPPAKE